ncbi:MAG TPA: transglycosylase domain-containing protein [Candidatus Deferrimicrobiaceae bacterium]|nr:transglycosylase domain-containing protein [Candidatus Deferrimicrobiaceae bacterium]
MHTSLQRRQRHRRNGAARRGRGGGAARRAALAIPLLLFTSLLVLGSVGFVGVVSAYAYYSRDLPDPARAFEGLEFEQPSVVWDRTGTVELARFGALRRELLTFDQIPPEMIDATTAIEDGNFWTNPGFDAGAVISAALDTISGRPRGASTITQQLVRAKLLPAWAFEGTIYDRKIREIIQSIRLTEAFPGDEGKKQIIEAYLNQNFYGNQSYGVKAAAIGYFSTGLPDLSLAQYAILAAIPQSPTEFDLMRNAVAECLIVVADEAGEECPADQVKLVVPATSEIVQRRNRVLEFMKTRSVLSGDRHTLAEYEAAKKEEVVLNPPVSPRWKAPHFVDRIREQLSLLLCGPESEGVCEAVDTGGYRVVTTLDWDMQQIVEKWIFAAGRAQLAKDTNGDGSRNDEIDAILKRIGIPKSQWGWVRGLKGYNIHNAAGAVIDYRTGEVLASAGSAGYYLNATDKGRLAPQHDVMFDAYRQPGSSIKPLNYITGLDDRTMTASTMFMDVVTEFQKGWAPKDADPYERGPVRLRPALQFSLNIPSIKAGYINGHEHLFSQFQKWGLELHPEAFPSPAMAIGTIEIHMLDLLEAYGGIANGGVLMPRQVIREIYDNEGNLVYPGEGDEPIGTRVASEQAAWLISDILEGNTLRSVNAYWATWSISDGGKRRPAAYKTGTTDENKDIDAFGYLAPPDDPDVPALAVGVWMGNSNGDPIRPITSVASSAGLWSNIMSEVSKGLPITDFERSKGLTRVEVDAFSGLLPGPGTARTVQEWFIEGTEPTRRSDIHVEKQIDEATGLLWQDGCAGPAISEYFLDFSGVEPAFPQWQRFTQGWASRAAKGPGVRGGPKRTSTSYFFDGYLVPFGRTWGGTFAPTEVCTSVPQPCPPGNGNGGNPFETPAVPCFTPEPTPPATDQPQPSNGGGGGGGGKPTPTPTITPAPPPPTPSPAPGLFLPLLLPAAAFALSRRHRPRR